MLHGRYQRWFPGGTGEGLSARDLEIMNIRATETLKATAERFGISASRVWQIEQRA